MKKYLQYKAEKKYSEGLTDRRSCLMILLAEARLTGRVAIIPKFNLSGRHNNGSKIESYLIHTYFEIDDLGVEYILEEKFIKLEQQLSSSDVLSIEDKKFDYNTSKTLVVRNLKDDNFWKLKRIYETFDLAKLYHGVGVKFIIPLVTAPQYIKAIGDRILNHLKKPTIGLHLRRGDRLNSKLDQGMDQQELIRKLHDFEYKSVFYSTNDENYQICQPNFFRSKHFRVEKESFQDNYVLFCIEMYVIDHCDISVRTFNDSSPFYHTDNQVNKNYAICNYSMHGSNNQVKKIPNELVKCDYEDYAANTKKGFVRREVTVTRAVNEIKTKLKSLYK